MNRKISAALLGVFIGLLAAWGLIKVAESGYAFGRFLATSVSASAAAPASSSH
jgi:hypothetical protein